MDMEENGTGWTRVQYRRGRMVTRRQFREVDTPNYDIPTRRGRGFAKTWGPGFEQFSGRPTTGYGWRNDFAFQNRTAKRSSSDSRERPRISYAEMVRRPYRPWARQEGKPQYRNASRSNEQYRYRPRVFYNETKQRSGYTQRNYNQTRPNNRQQNENTYTPADPELKQQIHLILKLIRLVHHLGKISPTEDGEAPITFSRLETFLSNIIRPAFPNDRTKELLLGNTKNWIYTNQIILRDHYETTIRETLEEFTASVQGDWKLALEIAARWAYRRLGNRLHPDTMESVEALLVASLPDTLDDQQPTGGHQQKPPLQKKTQQRGEQQPPQQKSQQRTQQGRKLEQSTHMETQTSPQDFGDPEPPEVGIPSTTVLQQPQTSPQESADAEPPEVDAPMTLAPQEAPPTPTGPQREFEALPQRQRFANPCVTDVIMEIASNSQGNQTPPRPQRPRQEGDSTPLTVIGQPSMAPTLTRRQLDISHLLAPRKPTELAPQPLETSQSGKQNLIELDEEEDLLSTSVNQDRSPVMPTTPQRDNNGSGQTEMIRPIRHMNTPKKLVDWHLSVQKKWLIIGDSNLSHFPPYRIPDLQIDSFPGAGFLHAETLLKKAITNSNVEKLVLAFGINHRTQKLKQTTIKQLQRAIHAAKTRFPYSEIWVPEINFSRNLPLAQQIMLEKLNTYIRNNMGHIPPLPVERFVVRGDHIHWTPNTAKAMLDHWVAHLNF